jgi:hypothetical protein
VVCDFNYLEIWGYVGGGGDFRFISWKCVVLVY